MSTENGPTRPATDGTRRAEAAEPEELRISEADRLPPWLETPHGEHEEKKRSPILLAAAAVGAVALLGFAWLAYQNATGVGGSAPPPVITAEDGPSKVRPEDPGGLDVPNQDKTVYDRVTGPGAAEPEQLLPPPERPAEPLAPAPVAAPEPKASAPAPAAKTAVAPAAKPAPAPAPAKPAAAPAPAPVKLATAGAFMIQLGAFNSDGRARAGWDMLKKKHAGVLGGLAPEVERADLGARGVLHRLRAGPFGSREAAGAACGALKSMGDPCMIVPR